MPFKPLVSVIHDGLIDYSQCKLVWEFLNQSIHVNQWFFEKIKTLCSYYTTQYVSYMGKNWKRKNGKEKKKKNPTSHVSDVDATGLELLQT